MIAAMVSQMVQMKYGRAGRVRVGPLRPGRDGGAGYDPKAMLEVMRILAQAGGGERQPEWLSSHPLPETRIDEIEAYLRQMPAPAGRSARGGR